METSLVVKIVTDYLLKKANDAGIPISKTQLYAAISVVVVTITYLIGSLVFSESVEKEIVKEKVQIEQTQVIIEDLKDTLETVTPPDKEKIKTEIKREVENEQDNDASVF